MAIKDRLHVCRAGVASLAVGLLLAALLLAGGTGQGAPVTAVGDPRYGVIITGGADIAGTLQALGASSWYTFGTASLQAPGRVELVRPGVDLNALAARARAAPGTAYLIANEPNVGGQDGMSPASYADFLATVSATIRGADLTAVLVGPNVLNWDDTCQSCPGFPSGRTWSEEFLNIYQARYGPVPFHVWGMHVYSLDWTHLPLINAAADQAQLTAARAWLDARGLAHLPMWVTEFGVLWGYDGLQFVVQPDGSMKVAPSGQFRADLIASYLDQMFGWFVQNAAVLRLERWFLYASVATTEPWATAPAGIGLLQDGALTLTSFGQQYLSWATARSGPTATPTLAAVCTPRPRVEVSVTPGGDRRLLVTLATRGTNVRLLALRFGGSTGALVDLGSFAGLRGNFSLALTPGTTQTTFYVRQETPGQSATVPLVVVDSCGDWPTFVGGGPNAFVPTGSAAPGATTPSYTATPAPAGGPAPACTPRPPVQVLTAPEGDRLRVTLSTQGSANVTLRAVRFETGSNALVDVPDGPTGVSAPFTWSLPAGTRETRFFVRPATPGQAVTVPLVVVDSCGEWPTFVGRGPGLR